jgi:hypothetical protein
MLVVYVVRLLVPSNVPEEECPLSVICDCNSSNMEVVSSICNLRKHRAVVTWDPHNEYNLILNIKFPGENLRLFSLIYFHYHKDTSKKNTLLIVEASNRSVHRT